MRRFDGGRGRRGRGIGGGGRRPARGGEFGHIRKASRPTQRRIARPSTHHLPSADVDFFNFPGFLPPAGANLSPPEKRISARSAPVPSHPAALKSPASTVELHTALLHLITLHSPASFHLSTSPACLASGVRRYQFNSWLGMQDQLICSGCKRVLQYRRGATGVCCPGCNIFTAATEMSELVCGGCFTMLVYNRGAANIRCPHCSRVNSTRSANQIGHLSCGHCRTTLAYPPGASTVGCPTCRCVNPVRNNNSGGSARADARPQTVLVENPKTIDEKGKLVSNVAVGVTSWKR